jgi:hypothetical protein
MSRLGAGAGVPPVAARDLAGDDDARRVLNDAWIPDSGDTAGGATRASRLAASSPNPFNDESEATPPKPKPPPRDGSHTHHRPVSPEVGSLPLPSPSLVAGGASSSSRSREFRRSAPRYSPEDHDDARRRLRLDDAAAAAAAAAAKRSSNISSDDDGDGEMKSLLRDGVRDDANGGGAWEAVSDDDDDDDAGVGPLGGGRLVSLTERSDEGSRVDSETTSTRGAASDAERTEREREDARAHRGGGGGGANSSRVDEVRSIHWSPYDRVGVVNADP